MKIKNKVIKVIERIKERFIKHKMNERDKKLFIEAVILIVIYMLSFAILSLGMVQQTILNMLALTFIFAVVITLIIYLAYKKLIK